MLPPTNSEHDAVELFLTLSLGPLPIPWSIVNAMCYCSICLDLTVVNDYSKKDKCSDGATGYPQVSFKASM